MSALAGEMLVVPKSSEETVRIGILAEGDGVALPAVLGSQPTVDDGVNLMTFVQVPQRLGMETELIHRSAAVLEELDVVLVLNPEISDKDGSSEAWFSSVLEWVSEGGRLLILSRSAHAGHEHDASFRYIEDVDMHSHPVSIDGLVLQHAELGSGFIVHVIGSEELDVQDLGHCMAYPSTPQRAKYEWIYAIFEDFLGLPTMDRKTYSPR